MNDETRTLPMAPELEEAVLGAILLEYTSEACMNAVDYLEPEYFAVDAHQIIFRAIREMYAAGERVDILTVTDKLRVEKTLPQVGGAYYISKLTDRIASSANIDFHARIVVQKWVHRRIIFYGQSAVNKAYNEDPDIFALFDELREFLLIEDKLIKQGSEAQAVGNYIGLEIEDSDMRVASHKTGKTMGVPTGLRALDNAINGWQDARLVIIAARPGMGKTSLVKGFALHATEWNFPVAFFSLEMNVLQLLQSILTGIAEVDNERYQKGIISDQEQQLLMTARDKVSKMPLYIDDTTNLSITQIRSRARKLKQKHGIKMVIVDYLQLAEGTKGYKSAGNREQEISSVSRGLKALSKELNLPVLALSQLSRSVETRGGDKRPQLSDLRESGAIEQDADMVMFIHRPEYYGLTTDPNSGDSTHGLAELIIAKNRGGVVETVDVRFEGKFTKFHDNSSNQFGGLRPNTQFTEDKF